MWAAPPAMLLPRQMMRPAVFWVIESLEICLVGLQEMPFQALGEGLGSIRGPHFKCKNAFKGFFMRLFIIYFKQLDNFSYFCQLEKR